MYQTYTLQRRPTTKARRFIYYCQFRDKHGKRMTAVSTGKTTKAEAREWAQDRIERGLVNRKADQRFAEYVQDWFDWAKSPYLKRKRQRGGYSRSYAEHQAMLLRNHIVPYFSKIKVSSITGEDVETWLTRLANETSPATANRSLTVLKVIYKEAIRLGHVPVSPAALVEKLVEITVEKGILTLDEIDRLFRPESYAEIWKDDIKRYVENFHYAVNALACTTGMRIGEIQALQWDAIEESYIDICCSWDRKNDLVPPKANSFRLVPLKPDVRDLLLQIRQDTSLKMGIESKFVFPNSTGEKPVDHKVISKYLYRALEQIGIDESIRRQRNITFHSWRHTYNTYLRVNVSDADLSPKISPA